MSLILAVPASIVALQQQGLLERAFHDGLVPNLAYRSEAMAEEWPANTGTEIFMTRPGLLLPVTTANVAGSDPAPQTVPYEQWSAVLDQYAATIDTDVPTAVVANANLFLRNIHQLGIQAGMSINRIARNAMFKAYLSGQTNAKTTIGSGDTQIAVSSINGFTDVVAPGSNVKPAPVGPANPLPIKVGTGATVVTASVVGATSDDPADPTGPGILYLSAAIGTAFAGTRTPVKSIYAPRVVRAAGGDSVDAIGAGDTLVLQQSINAVAKLRQANVQPHEDGFYHAHISPDANAQIFADPVFQRLNQSLPEHVTYKEGFIGTISGVMFFMNTESPNDSNTGPLTDTAANGSNPKAKYAKDISAEVQNGNNVKIARTLITGKGAIYEKYLDETQYVTEAGITGKIGEFSVTNNGIEIKTERIRLVLRAPLDRLQQKVAATWSITTSFPVPSDVTATSGLERYKRAVVLEHAAG